MYRHSRLKSSDGFTLIELMIVIAIVGILVSVATVSYSYFVAKAKAVEAETAIHEVERLESSYRASHDVYTDSFADLGFSMAGTLKYYTAEVRIGSSTDKMSYQVRVFPAQVSATDAWLLTNFLDGSVQVDRIPATDLAVFASVRYMGYVAPMTSVEATNIYTNSGMSGLGSGASDSNEPEWSGGGSNSQCKECGHTVINTPASHPSVLK
jgi:prepilin-type N-terminal cleavage/methylation domain-containing protein